MLSVRKEDEGKPVLVLDLDGTLVSACDSRRCQNGSAYDFGVTVPHSQTFTERLVVKKRPGLDQFLADMAQLYEVIVFSYSVAPYVNAIMDVIDPQQQLVAHRLSNESCPTGSKRVYSPVFGSRDRRRLVWLDDSPNAFDDSPDNGIVVTHFNVEQFVSQGLDPNKDKLFQEVSPFLKSIASCTNVSEPLARWKKSKHTKCVIM